MLSAGHRIGFGEIRTEALNFALCLLECGAVHVLATDAHDHKYRKPILSKARDIIVSWFGVEVARALTDLSPVKQLPHPAQLSHQPSSRRLPDSQVFGKLLP